MQYLDTELNSGPSSLYAALAFHTALYKLEWQPDEDVHASAPEGYDKEMWEKLIKNDLWSMTGLNLTGNKRTALLKGWPSESGGKVSLLPLLQNLIPSEFHKDIEAGKIPELRKGSETMKQVDSQVKEYLEAEGPFPQLWKSFIKMPQLTEGKVQVSIKIELDQDHGEARELHHVFENLDTLKREGVESLFLALVSQFTAGLKSTEQEVIPTPAASIRETLDRKNSKVNKDFNNNSKTADDVIAVKDSLSNLRAKVGDTKISPKDYEAAIRYLGPDSLIPKKVYP